MGRRDVATLAKIHSTDLENMVMREMLYLANQMLFWKFKNKNRSPNIMNL